MACGCKKNLTHYVKGAAKAVQSAVGIGLAEVAVIESRRSICRKCEYAEPCATGKQKCTCSQCGCRLYLKTRLESETCPEGKW